MGFLKWHPFRIYLLFSTNGSWLRAKLVAVQVRFVADLYRRTRRGPISHSTRRKLLPLWYEKHKMVKQNKSIMTISLNIMGFLSRAHFSSHPCCHPALKTSTEQVKHESPSSGTICASKHHIRLCSRRIRSDRPPSLVLQSGQQGISL